MLMLHPTARLVNDIAFGLGRRDAAANILCVPEAFYVAINDQRDYARGYESVNGPTLTTQQFLGGAR